MVIRLKHAKLFAAALILLGLALLFAVQPRQIAQPFPVEGPAPGVDLPVVMYHSVNGRPGEQGEFVLSPKEFEEDLIYLRDHGYETVVIQDLIDFTQKGTPLPEKPVMLTFDDGFENNYTQVFPLLKKYGMRAVISPVGAYSEEFSRKEEHSDSYAYLTWDQIDEMDQSGLVEFQNHTYDMHAVEGERKGAAIKQGESEEAYRRALTEDVGRMQEQLGRVTGKTPTAFAYPFGFVSRESVPALRDMGFLATLSVERRVNHLTGDPEELYGLGRFNRPHGVSSEAFFEGILASRT